MADGAPPHEADAVSLVRLHSTASDTRLGEITKASAIPVKENRVSWLPARAAAMVLARLRRLSC